MASRKKFRKKIERKKVLGPCPFCQSKTDPNYKEYEDLKRFVTERARIVSRGRTGLCSKHQRKLSIAIKRARHLGLLPFRAQV